MNRLIPHSIPLCNLFDRRPLKLLLSHLREVDRRSLEVEEKVWCLFLRKNDELKFQDLPQDAVERADLVSI
jgi:hypothetical protein